MEKGSGKKGEENPVTFTGLAAMEMGDLTVSATQPDLCDCHIIVKLPEGRKGL